MIGASCVRDGPPEEPAGKSVAERLRWSAAHQPDRPVFTFLVDGDGEAPGQVETVTYRELDRRASAIAAELVRRGAVGERALLLYPPGLDYVAGFFGCLYAGTIPVPAYPPDPTRLERTLPRLHEIVTDSVATLALTNGFVLGLRDAFLAHAPDLGALAWIATETLPPAPDGAWSLPAWDSGAVAFLQYTSGSTAVPKGVVLTHGNLSHNLGTIRSCFGISGRSVGVSWLPPYHDMGLIGFLLQPVWAGCTQVLLSPIAFLQRPLRWLRAISRFGGTISGGPNFAYDLCLRKVAPADRVALRLDTWETAFNAAEPIRPATLREFAETFAACGFRRDSLITCYGLAEASLMVTAGPARSFPRVRSVDKAALAAHRAVDAAHRPTEAISFVSCGRLLPETRVVVVDPDTRRRRPPDGVGELWVAGPSVAAGYWNRADESRDVFAAELADVPAARWLRTGDLGFVHDGHLYMTGRRKDLVIVAGRNHYPHDIEQTVEACHAGLRPGGGAAFAVDTGGEERLCVVHEVNRHVVGPTELDGILAAVRRAVAEAHGLEAHAVVLVQAGSIPKTSSGKIRRGACRTAFLEGTLEAVAETRSGRDDMRKRDRRRSVPLRTPADVERWLVAELAKRLDLDPATVDVREQFTAFGLSSIEAASMVGDLELRLGCQFPAALVWDYPTIESLATFIAARLATEAGDAPPADGAIVPAR